MSLETEYILCRKGKTPGSSDNGLQIFKGLHVKGGEDIVPNEREGTMGRGRAGEWENGNRTLLSFHSNCVT